MIYSLLGLVIFIIIIIYYPKVVRYINLTIAANKIKKVAKGKNIDDEGKKELKTIAKNIKKLRDEGEN